MLKVDVRKNYKRDKLAQTDKVHLSDANTYNDTKLNTLPFRSMCILKASFRQPVAYV